MSVHGDHSKAEYTITGNFREKNFQVGTVDKSGSLASHCVWLSQSRQLGSSDLISAECVAWFEASVACCACKSLSRLAVGSLERSLPQ